MRQHVEKPYATKKTTIGRRLKSHISVDTGGKNGCFRQEPVETQNAICPIVMIFYFSGTGSETSQMFLPRPYS